MGILSFSFASLFKEDRFNLQLISLQLFITMFIQVDVIVKGKGNGPGSCNSAAYMSQFRHYRSALHLVSGADYHELIVLQRIMRPSMRLLMNNRTRGAASRHTTAPINHTRP